ncbi:MAG: FxSxx-COOH system tetratricopeptide repeat protein [Armatimonadota bacterium]|jgi:tetratricopeptide (TPR) repeat protein
MGIGGLFRRILGGEEESPGVDEEDLRLVPVPRNQHFTGREGLLAELREALASGRPAALTQASDGPGGVGRTQVALEYAYRHEEDYGVIWWVRAEEPSMLAADYAALAEQLRLPQSDATEQGLSVEAVREWQAGNERWLLVFDSAPGPEAVREYLPRAETGHVIITSDNPDWSGVAQALTVEVLAPEEAIELLLRGTGQEDQEAAGELAEELGYLPLALAQARACMAESNRSLADYLELYRGRREDDPVATTLGLSLDAVAAESPAASDLLSLCAFLAPEDIPLGMIFDGAGDLPERLAGAAADSARLEELRSVLGRYSLVECTGDAMSIHPLVQAVVRDGLTEDDARTWCGAAAQTVTTSFPFECQEPHTWGQCYRLLGHALGVARHCEALGAGAEPGGSALCRLGLYLHGLGEMGPAQSALERARKLHEGAYGPEHSQVAAILGNLGLVLRDLGDLEGARELYERALAMDEKAHGPDYPDVAVDLNNLGSVLYAMGDLPGAVEHLERALAINERAYGADDPQVASALCNLATVLEELGDPAGAGAHYERAMAINEKSYGPEHPEIAGIAKALGDVLHGMGQLPAAREQYERALRIDEKAYGRDHPDMATRASDLGLVLQELDDPKGARKYFEQALAISERVYGPDHPDVARDINNLGLVLQDLGDLAGAREHYERALAIDENAHGHDHPTVAIRLNNLGHVLQGLGDLAGAREHLERAVAIQETAGRPDDPDVATFVSNLGLVLEEEGDLAGAREHYERALAIKEKAYGPDHPFIAITLNNLGSLLEDLGDPEGARAHYERAYTIRRESLGEEHPRTVFVRGKLEALGGE